MKSMIEQIEDYFDRSPCGGYNWCDDRERISSLERLLRCAQRILKEEHAKQMKTCQCELYQICPSCAPQRFTKALDDIAALPTAPVAPASPVTSPPVEPPAAVSALKPVAAKAPPVPKDPAPGKDKSYFELTIKLVGSEEPPFTVETPLTGNGAADKHNATAIARKRYPGKEMTIVTSRIYTKTANALSEIAPGSTLSSLFGATGGPTEDLIEIGRAFHDGSRGTIFLRNLRTHVGVTFRPATGGLIVFSNRIVSNRLASELPLIVAEVLGNNAREIEIYLKP